MFDRKIWAAIGNKKNCSFKIATKLDTLCRNKYNVTGLCNEFSCPLANTKYATVRAVDDALYLYVKEPERSHMPKAMYEKIKLSDDYAKALEEIEAHLEFWDKEIIHKCKQRMTKLTEYLERVAHAEEHGMQELMVRKTKMNRREKIRALKALNTVNFEKEIGDELMMRLEAGVYGEEAKQKYERAHDIYKKKSKRRYVVDFEESAEAADRGASKKAQKKKNKKKAEEEVADW
ncbi:protein MAK16 [Pancytospora philotis]|nr:protein MAK16 [Pancytospora philotis]